MPRAHKDDSSCGHVWCSRCGLAHKPVPTKRPPYSIDKRGVPTERQPVSYTHLTLPTILLV
eukprot:2724541-Amphidinium_carterae.1